MYIYKLVHSKKYDKKRVLMYKDKMWKNVHFKNAEHYQLVATIHKL